jgi:hypothetical protein
MRSATCAAFPRLPVRQQFNRLQRGYREAIVAFALFLVEQMQAQQCLDEALDSSGIPTRDAKRRGTGWLAGQADIGLSNRIGWDAGLHVLTSITPTGVITGFGFAPASCNDHAPLRDLFRRAPHSLATLVPCGRACPGGLCGRQRLCRGLPA